MTIDGNLSATIIAIAFIGAMVFGASFDRWLTHKEIMDGKRQAPLPESRKRLE